MQTKDGKHLLEQALPRRSRWHRVKSEGQGQQVRPRRVLIACAASLALSIPLAARAQTPPSVAQISFSPATIQSGGTSQLSIVLSNPNASAATLEQTLIDSLPSGLTVAGGGGTCPGTVSAKTGSGTVSYAGGSIIPAQGCVITATVNVKLANNAGTLYLTDAIPAGALVTSLGTSAAGASGTLTVRAGVTVPTLANLTQAAAAAAIQGAGLTLGTVSRAVSPTTPYNLVAAQSPIAGTAVAAGSVVAIVVSNGPSGVVTNPNTPLTSTTNAGNFNPTQVSVAGAVDRVCKNLQAPGSVLNTLQQNLLANCTAIVQTYSGNATNASLAGLKSTLDAVSGKQATAQQRTGVEFAGTQFANIASRLVQLRQGASGASFADLNTGAPMGSDLGQLVAMLKGESSPGQSSSGQSSPGEVSPAQMQGGGAGDAGEALSRWGFFVNGNLIRGTQDTTSEETGFDFRSNGVTAGIDYRVTSNLVLGIAAGHSNGNTDFTDGSGRIDSRSNTGSLYGTYYKDAFYVDAIATFGHISYDMSRTTSYTINPTAGTAPNCIGTVCSIDMTGETGARQLAFGGSVGYSFHMSGLTLGPDVAIDYTRVDLNGFSENDPDQTGMALAYGSQIGESLLLKAGGHLSYAISTPVAVILPQVRAHYIHEFKNDQRALEAHFVDDPTVNSANGPISSFTVFNDLPDRDYLDWAAGITAQFPFGIAAFVDYSALAGYSQLQTHELSFGIRFQYLVH